MPLGPDAVLGVLDGALEGVPAVVGEPVGELDGAPIVDGTELDGAARYVVSKFSIGRPKIIGSIVARIRAKSYRWAN